MLLFWAVVWLACCIACISLAEKKGLSAGWWFILGCVFGPIALILLAIWPKNQVQLDKNALAWGHARKCPSCAEIVKAEAKRCRYCGQDLLAPAGIASAPAPQPGKLDWPESDSK